MTQPNVQLAGNPSRKRTGAQPCSSAVRRHTLWYDVGSCDMMNAHFIAGECGQTFAKPPSHQCDWNTEAGDPWNAMILGKEVSLQDMGATNEATMKYDL